MITEDYCSFELCKLLAEKVGFNEICDHYIDEHWREEGILLHTPCRTSDLMFGYMCPTHQMAMKWLREEHQWDVFISPIWEVDIPEYFYTFHIQHCMDKMGTRSKTNHQHYCTYEEAVEAAIKYSLENLI